MNYKSHETQFHPNTIYRIFNFSTSKFENIKIIDRDEKWVKVELNGKQKTVRVNQITNPKSESILIDDYSPIFAYENPVK